MLLRLRNVGCLGIVRTPSSTAPTGRWRAPRTRENGRVSSISAPPSSSRRVRPRKRSEEHTSELQSLTNLVCRLLLEKKKKPKTAETTDHPSHKQRFSEQS